MSTPDLLLLTSLLLPTVLLLTYLLFPTTAPYIPPKQLARDIISHNLETLDSLKSKFSYSNLLTLIRGNLIFLRLSDSIDASPNDSNMAFKKLRNICLCLEMLQNRQVVGESTARRVREVREIVRNEERYWGRLKREGQKLTAEQEGVNSYLAYLREFAAK